jgi:hypothetical protein
MSFTGFEPMANRLQSGDFASSVCLIEGFGCEIVLLTAIVF